MHTRLTSVSSSADSTHSACPARPDLTAPHAPTASSPAAALTPSRGMPREGKKGWGKGGRRLHEDIAGVLWRV